MSITDMTPASVSARVAGEVRAWLGRRNISANHAARKLGWTQPYISRRIRGDVPFNVVDLEELAQLLDVDPVEFQRDPPKTGFRKVPLRHILRPA